MIHSYVNHLCAGALHNGSIDRQVCNALKTNRTGDNIEKEKACSKLAQERTT